MPQVSRKWFWCKEHGLVKVRFRKDPKMASGQSAYCVYCAHLNFKAWEVVNKERNRRRAREWRARQ